MIMIVANHTINHGVFKVLSENPYTLWQSGTIVNRSICALTTSWGQTGVAVFFMITGYFLSDREDFSVKSVWSLLSKIHYFGAQQLFILIVLTLIGVQKSQYNWPFVIKNSLLIPTTLWWFAYAYLFLLFLIPSINIFIKPFRKKKLLPAIIVFIWLFFYVTNKNSGYFNLFKAILFYLCGVWIKDNSVNRMKQRKYYISILSVLSIMLWLISGWMSWIIIDNTVGTASGLGVLFERVLEGILIPMRAACLVLIFENLPIQNDFVNRIAGCTFTIYLFHDYQYLRDTLWHTILKIDTVQYMSHYFPLYLMMDVVIIFSVGILMEQVRISLLKYVKNRKTAS